MSQGFTCDRCSRCCFTHRVPLTGADLKRLAWSGENPAHFVEFLPPEDLDLIGEPESIAQLREGRRFLVLRHIGEGENTHCIFLGEHSCRVHAARPLACRTYPYDRPDNSHPSPPPDTLGLVPHHLCPEESGVLVTLRRSREVGAALDPLVRDFAKAVKQRDQEASEHAERLARWNRAQRTRLKLGRLPQSGSELIRALST